MVATRWRLGLVKLRLIVDDDQALVVDTLFDVPLTRDMLAAYADATKAAKNINMVVNTHHNGDHCNGNCCCPDAKIIAHRATAEHMALEPPTWFRDFSTWHRKWANWANM